MTTTSSSDNIDYRQIRFKDSVNETFLEFDITSDNLKLDSFYRILPGNIDIFKNFRTKNQISANEELDRAVFLFLMNLQNELLYVRRILKIESNLQPLNISVISRDEVIIEWNFKDFRIGFALETGKEAIEWYLVSNKNLDELSISGEMLPESLKLQLRNLILFVLKNT